jgi:hypothetical protein
MMVWKNPVATDLRPDSRLRAAYPREDPLPAAFLDSESRNGFGIRLHLARARVEAAG